MQRLTEDMPTLNWIGKEKVVNHADAVPFHVLERDIILAAHRKIKSNGDNLLALSLSFRNMRTRKVYLSTRRIIRQ